jgi:hypothetical protein
MWWRVLGSEHPAGRRLNVRRDGFPRMGRSRIRPSFTRTGGVGLKRRLVNLRARANGKTQAEQYAKEVYSVRMGTSGHVYQSRH